MISPIWAYSLAAVAGLFALCLAVAGIALNTLSRGTVRKLEPRHRKMAERLDELLRNKDTTMMSVRLVLAVDLLVIVYCLLCIIHPDGAVEGGTLPVLPLCFTVVAFLLYYGISEIAGRHLSGIAAGRYLTTMAIIVKGLVIPLLPLLWLLRLLHARVEYWQGEHGQDNEKVTTEDEIMSLVESVPENEEESNELEDDERRMIRGVFDLDETLVREIMTPRVDLHTVPDTAAIEQIKACIVECGHSRIPVYHESVDHVVGVVYSKDLLNEKRLLTLNGLEELYHRPVFIPESKNVGDLLAEFQQSQIHFAVILDEYGGTAGVVSMEDVLEEIVGEIRDEYDVHETEPLLATNEDGSVTAEARVPLSDVLELLDVTVPEDIDCDTLGGYISCSVGRIPECGETVVNGVLEFDILEADIRRVLKTTVRALPEADGESEDE